MTKQFLITVQMGERSRFHTPEDIVVQHITFTLQDLIQRATVGPVPAVKVEAVPDGDALLEEEMIRLKTVCEAARKAGF